MTKEPCPSCEYYSENGEYVCFHKGEAPCQHPACGPCAHDRWAHAFPVEVLEEEYDRACERAQAAEEGDWPDWQQESHYAAYLARVLEEIEERREAGASQDELDAIARAA